MTKIEFKSGYKVIEEMEKRHLLTGGEIPTVWRLRKHERLVGLRWM